MEFFDFICELKMNEYDQLKPHICDKKNNVFLKIWYFTETRRVINLPEFNLTCFFNLN